MFAILNYRILIANHYNIITNNKTDFCNYPIILKDKNKIKPFVIKEKKLTCLINLIYLTTYNYVDV